MIYALRRAWRHGISLLLLVAIVVFAVMPRTVDAANTHSAKFLNAYFSIASQSSTGLNLTSDFTIESWFKLRSNYGTVNGLIGNFDIASSSGYALELNSLESSPNYEFVLIVGNGTSVEEVKWDYVPITYWTHVAVVANYTSNTYELYVNGLTRGTRTATLHPASSNADFTVGRDYNIGFDGKMDEVRVWNTVRSGQNISDNRFVEVAPSANLKGYWKMNNSSADASDNNNTLTNNGTVYDSDIPSISNTGLKIRKDTTESLVSSTTLQGDDQLSITLRPYTTYSVDGMVFMKSEGPLIKGKLALISPASTTMMIGYMTAEGNDVLSQSGSASMPITLAAGVTVPIMLRGTVRTEDVAGEIHLQWAQNVSSGTALSVARGSYLSVEPIN